MYQYTQSFTSRYINSYIFNLYVLDMDTLTLSVDKIYDFDISSKT